MEISRKFQLELFSNQYYEFLEKFVNTEFEDDKVLGKFYTHPEVGQQMAAELVSHLLKAPYVQTLRIVDPFCGDGRLITLLLQEVSKFGILCNRHYELYIWDIDEKAVNRASASIKEQATALNLDANINAGKIDAFVAYLDYEKSFDVCITNPPWGLLKPQKLFNYRCSVDELERYKSAIAMYDNYMKDEFILSQPTKKFGKWGTNLARCGVEVSLRLINENGICGIVSPASLFNDQVSVPLRKWIFESYKIHSVSFFPAELKLFGSADVASITTVIGPGCTGSPFTVRLYNRDFNENTYVISKDDFDFISRTQYVLPLELGFESLSILQAFDTMPTVEKECMRNNLRFVRELDETRISEKVQPDGRIIFAKGYMVDRYCFTSDNQFLNEEVVNPPDSINGYKLVWRDVSRSSQIRRLKATLLPPNHIAGNSLGAIAGNSDSIQYLTSLVGILNSLVFEFQARSRLVSNHVPSGIVKTLKIPGFSIDNTLFALVSRRLNGEDVEADIEAYVAWMYNLTYQQYCCVVDSFTFLEEEKSKLKEVAKKYLTERTA